MASLVNIASGRRLVLLPQHVFGRACTSTTVLDYPGSSRLHASIRWTGERWELRDHSRNGTLLNGRRLPPKVVLVLTEGQLLTFGVGPTSAWQVQDVERPSPLLVPADRDEDGRWASDDPVELVRASLLTSAPDTTISVVQEADGRWQCTMDAGARVLRDGDLVSVGGRRWCFLSCAG